MRVIGLTGGIASGKSTVSAYLRQLGAAVIDADVLARAVVEPGAEAYGEVVAAFGPEVLHPDGSLNREALGRIVFADAAARLKLEQIIHPAVRRRMQSELQAAREAGATVAVLDIPLLFESGLQHLADQIWVVWVDEATQLQRLMKRNGYSETDARQRLASQWPLDRKRALADVVIDNSGSLGATHRQVAEAWQRL